MGDSEAYSAGTIGCGATGVLAADLETMPFLHISHVPKLVTIQLVDATMRPELAERQVFRTCPTLAHWANLYYP